MKHLWIAFSLVMIVSFAGLGWIGVRTAQEAPPLEVSFVTNDGHTVIEEGKISAGQNVWQSLGGLEVGSIWGHGSYVAPDWTADWLHREAVYILNAWAKEEFHHKYNDLQPEHQAQLRGRLRGVMRTNTFDQGNNTITIDPIRFEAFESNLAYYSKVFLEGRVDYAIPAGTVSSTERMRSLSAFFFWSSWAAVTHRPQDTISYTNNWPYEPLVGNQATGDAVVWTGVSIIALLAGISAMVWWYAARRKEEFDGSIPKTDPLAQWKATPSQKATAKCFAVVSALLLSQMLLGVIAAHYGVEGDGFYGFPLSKWLPYSVARTWHNQIGLFWIATAWLAAGLFIGPLINGHEPKGQRLGVNILFVALLIVVLGSLAGEWMSVHHYLSDTASFYFGHQGYEYVDLGRAWQIALFIGLLLWLFLMLRTMAPALHSPNESKPLVVLLAVSTAAIALFYGAGLTWGQHSHLSMVEYWRWWVVHLWVEGFFEVFATTVIAFFFMRLQLIHPAAAAAAAALLSATIFLAGGIIGTCHHLYFTGSPPLAMAWGAAFSALEVVPLVMVGFDANEELRRSRQSPWIRRYQWPVYFFIAVAFWNRLGPASLAS